MLLFSCPSSDFSEFQDSLPYNKEKFLVVKYINLVSSWWHTQYFSFFPCQKRVNIWGKDPVESSEMVCEDLLQVLNHMQWPLLLHWILFPWDNPSGDGPWWNPSRMSLVPNKWFHAQVELARSILGTQC